MTREELQTIMLERLEEAPYLTRDEPREIINMGAQILLPFEAGDAPVTFPSRWALAVAINQLMVEMLYDH